MNKINLKIVAIVMAIIMAALLTGCKNSKTEPSETITETTVVSTNTPNSTLNDDGVLIQEDNENSIDEHSLQEETTDSVEVDEEKVWVLSEIPAETGIIYNEQEQTLVYPVAWNDINFGNVVYSDVAQAGIHENGDLVMIIPEYNQEIWIDAETGINKIPSSDSNSITNGSTIYGVPTADNLEAEYFWKIQNGYDIVAIMIVKNEINLSFNSDCQHNFSDELKAYATEIESKIMPKALEERKADVIFFADLLEGESKGFAEFPFIASRNTGAGQHDTDNLHIDFQEPLKNLVDPVMEQEYPGYYNAMAASCEFDYLFKNTNEKDPLKYVNEMLKLKRLTENFCYKPSEASCRNYLDFLYDPNNLIIIPVNSGTMSISYGTLNRAFEVNGELYEPIDIYPGTIRHGQMIASRFARDPLDGFTTTLGETSYMSEITPISLPEPVVSNTP